MEYARRLKLPNLAEHMGMIIHQAQEKQLTYSEFLLDCLAREIQGRESKNYSCRLKAAALPTNTIWTRMISTGQKLWMPEG